MGGLGWTDTNLTCEGNTTKDSQVRQGGSGRLHKDYNLRYRQGDEGEDGNVRLINKKTGRPPHTQLSRFGFLGVVSLDSALVGHFLRPHRLGARTSQEL